MNDAAIRLAKARSAAGYASASEAARAMGVPVPSYSHHENGNRGFAKLADRYARFFRVSVEWLLTGRGEMRARVTQLMLAVMGKVGAGAIVDMPTDPAGHEVLDEISIDLSGTWLLQVVGESMMPRYLPGEWLLIQSDPVPPERLVNQYAVVQVLDDGRRLVKMLRRGSKLGTYRLVSGNGTEEDNVALMAAWRIKGTIS